VNVRIEAKEATASWAAQLYDDCAAELLLYGRALGLSHAESEDVVHDSFRALLALEIPPREPRFYLIRTVRNRALNYRRSLWRRLSRELESQRWFEPAPDRTPEEEAAAHALVQLPPEQREVIVLKLWNNLTFEAIGSLLGISPNTAAGRYRYGLQKLRQSLRDLSHESARRPGNDPAWLPSAPAFPKT
jgi:RNA polymerase sigma-70 factor (ECF subfamily)